MKKKIVMMAATLALVAGSAFALPEFKMSAGIGGLFGSDFGGGAEISWNGGASGVKIPYYGGGGYAFFDATYAELSVGVLAGGGKQDSYATGNGFNNRPSSDYSIMNLNIGLLGKFPFAIGEKLLVFPALGIEYDVALSAKDENGDPVKKPGTDDKLDFNALWFKFGGGLDFAFTDHIFLRFEALYGIRLETQAEKDIKDVYEAMAPGMDVKTLLGHGLTAKLAVGYKF